MTVAVVSSARYSACSVAEQNAHPGTWFERDSDGCTGVFDFKWVNRKIYEACLAHDADYFWGSPDPKVKARADLRFRDNTRKGGFLGRRLAPGRYWAVRRFCFNTPPKKGSLAGPAERRYFSLWEAVKHGQSRVEPWNWEGPSRGEHANMEAQDHLLPEQIPEVAAAREVA